MSAGPPLLPVPFDRLRLPPVITMVLPSYLGPSPKKVGTRLLTPAH